ncbi:MAG: GNAT family N-acetyltransferase [Propionibacteriaceae bacterium]|nr:GNAT family N-acetyltransferase [Propionibacteriaceae bacterium]
MTVISDLATTTRGGLEIALQPFSSSDVDRVYELCQDPEIQWWTTVPTPYTFHDAEGFVGDYVLPAWNEVAEGTYSSLREGPELVWSVHINGESSLAGLWGSIGYKRLGDGELEIGWWLGAGARGHGIMRAAVATLIVLAFNPVFPLQARRVWWHAMVGNLPSAWIAQRTGFAYQGIEEHHGAGRCWSAMICPDDPIEPRDDWPELPL